MKRFYHWHMDRAKEAIWLLVVLLLVLGCHLTKNQFSKNVTFDVEGHRGSRGLMPENTIPAMYKALDLGVTTLEMDAVISKDRQVVVSHEPFFNHEISTKPDGSEVKASEERTLNIFAMNYDEVRNYDVGSKINVRFPRQQKIKVIKPRLIDLIDSVEAYCKRKGIKAPQYNIEVKSTPATDDVYHPEPQEFANLLIGVIQSRNINERVIIQSFDLRPLQYIHQRYPTFKTAMLIEENDKRSMDQQIKELGFSPDIYSPAYGLVNGVIVEKCRELKMKLIPWTVNDKATLERLKDLGVDGIITDYPDLMNQ